MKDKGTRDKPRAVRYGAAEIYGRAVATTPLSELKELIASSHRSMMCPFKQTGGLCNKKGGVCSIARYEHDAGGTARIQGPPVTTCPNRFLEDAMVFQWVGEIIVGSGSPNVVTEVPFLLAGNEGARDQNEVGRIDSVLVNIEQESISWCALEMQAVYFSGGKMEDDFAVMRS